MLSRLHVLKLTVAWLAVLGLAGGAAATASADSNLESMFQDDDHLIYTDTPTATRTMDTLQSLGVDRVRITVVWKSVAPVPDSATKPTFDASNPAAYPAGVWGNLDRVVRLARERNIAVNFNPTAPAPNWATGTPDQARLDQTYNPDAKEFGAFVHALGVRYSGSFMADGSLIPRVRYWSIWNEPNQGGWLTPQWARDPRATGAYVETSPVIYRNLVDRAWSALHETGHGDDTILIGDTAPKGAKDKGESRPMAALRFLRQLYCLDDNLQPYKGTSAELRSCPVGPNALADFSQQHPALFQSTGWATHPYELVFSPHTKPAQPDDITIANLSLLSNRLRRVYQRYRQSIPQKAKSVPLYLTEFSYQTNPPDPVGVTLGQQAAYLNEAEYRAYTDKNVRTLSQFLLVDDGPVPGDDPFGSTFQSGLQTDTGKAKPSYVAYAFPIYLPVRKSTSKGRLRIWGIPRVAPEGKRQTVTVEVRGKHGTPFKKLTTVKTDGRRGYLLRNITVKASGAVRLAWTDPAGKVWRSRAVAFNMPARKK